MRYGQIAGLDKPLSRLIMGTTACSTGEMERTSALLDYFVSIGGTTLDTARVYGRGDCERAVGQWLKARGNREQITLVGKGAHHDEHGPRVTPEAIAADLPESLAALRTGYIDLYLLHRDDPTRPVGPIMEALDEQRRAGRIRAFGASNWSTARIGEANDYARAHGLAPFVASSVNFSLAVMIEPPWPNCLSATVDGTAWYQANAFPLLAWSSQAQGFFTGRYSPGDRSNAEMVRCWYSEENFARLGRAAELGWQRGVAANSIALAYVLAQPFPIYALIGPHNVEEARDSAQALEIDLTPAECHWLSHGG